MSTPLFLKNGTHVIAIHSAYGDTRLVQTVEENISIVDQSKVTGVGIILDSDQVITPANRYIAIAHAMREKGLVLPPSPGEINKASPNTGVFVLPDNVMEGTLEDLMLECAQNIYPTLLASATTHVNDAEGDEGLNSKDLKALKKPAGKKKAIISAMASVLRPGKAIQVSIQDNRWLGTDGLKLARVKAVQDFLVSLFELS